MEALRPGPRSPLAKGKRMSSVIGLGACHRAEQGFKNQNRHRFSKPAKMIDKLKKSTENRFSIDL
jgi:hypothetical protein